MKKNKRLKHLLEDFAGLDLRPEQIGHLDITGDVYEYLIARFASHAGKKAGDFDTPSEASETLPRLVAHYLQALICKDNWPFYRLFGN